MANAVNENWHSKWHLRGFHTASVVLKRKVLGTRFQWCSDKNAWLERVMIAHREGFRGGAPDQLDKAELVDALVWRFIVTSEYDLAVGGMIMSPLEYVRCYCARDRHCMKPCVMHCTCMWCHKFTACVYAHQADIKHDAEFAKGVELPVGELGRARRHSWTWLGPVSKHEAPELYDPSAVVSPVGPQPGDVTLSPLTGLVPQIQGTFDNFAFNTVSVIATITPQDAAKAAVTAQKYLAESMLKNKIKTMKAKAKVKAAENAKVINAKSPPTKVKIKKK